jgi:glycosyltransferase involved in cell wall biosynthesis
MSMPIKIVFASVLKTIYDVRMYKKLAASVANKAEIHLIGAAIAPDKIPQNIFEQCFFYPTNILNRLSWQRWLFGFKFLQLLGTIKPNVMVVNTVELLPFAILYKIYRLGKVKLVYDVMENYFQNIAYQTTYPFLLRFPLAFAVRITENLASFFIDKFILAEKCYGNELEFIGNQYVIAENKFMLTTEKATHTTFTPKNIRNKKELHFIYSGTISKTYGTKEAIVWFINLQKTIAQQLDYQNYSLKLTVIGYCSDNSYYIDLQKLIKDTLNITWLVNTEQPVAHENILAALQQADIALLPYQINKSNKNRIPTKFYEYLYYQIPMIITKNPVWENFCDTFQSSLSCDFQQKDNLMEFWQTLQNKTFYVTEQSVSSVLWGQKEIDEIQRNLL